MSDRMIRIFRQSWKLREILNTSWDRIIEGVCRLNILRIFGVDGTNREDIKRLREPFNDWKA